MKRYGRRVLCLGVLCSFLFSVVPASAQMGAFSGFNSIRADSIQSNAKTGDFTIPSRFTATRGGMEISGDRAYGNAASQKAGVDGHVVLRMMRSVSLVGGMGGDAQGPSTLMCDHLDIDAQARRYHAIGGVRYVQGSRTIDADQADFDEARNQLRLAGGVSVAGMGSTAAGGFDTLKASTINANAFTGEFAVPGRFSATRGGVEITGDRAFGNSKKNIVVVSGNILVRVQKRSGLLTCDRLQSDEGRRVYHAIGHVRYIEPSHELTADAADMNDVTHILHLKGNVHVTDTSTPRTQDRKTQS
jgi:lipopolysaccharide assembly outer membrane protein LptD (OstA)